MNYSSYEERQGNYTSYRNREIESKLIVKHTTLDEVNKLLGELYGSSKTRLLFGSSVDTYWTISNPEVDADFIRMRERDGIRQITVKGKDKNTNLDRLEVDIDSTSDVAKISKLLTSAHGRPAGRIGKTYYVYWVGAGEHTTVCCYKLTEVEYPHIIVEVETTSMEKMLDLEEEVMHKLERNKLHVERAPGSLFELFINPGLYVNNKFQENK